MRRRSSAVWRISPATANTTSAGSALARSALSLTLSRGRERGPDTTGRDGGADSTGRDGEAADGTRREGGADGIFVGEDSSETGADSGGSRSVGVAIASSGRVIAAGTGTVADGTLSGTNARASSPAKSGAGAPTSAPAVGCWRTPAACRSAFAAKTSLAVPVVCAFIAAAPREGCATRSRRRARPPPPACRRPSPCRRRRPASAAGCRPPACD